MNHQPRVSRRDFIAAVAGVTGLAGCASAGRGGAIGDTSREDHMLYVGTYSDPGRREGVFVLRLDDRTGALTRLDAFDVGENPSFLAIHPDGHVLYAVNEVTEIAGEPTGAVAAFAIGSSGGLARLGTAQRTRGGAPCYVSVSRDGRVVLVANYVGGNIVALPVGADGALGADIQVEQHEGGGPNTARQEKAHAHSIVPDPSGRWALSADLGADRVYVYAVDTASRDGGTLREVSAASMRPGAGPRHLAFHPTLPIVFVANELDNTVATLRWDAERGTLAVERADSTLPPGWTGRSQVADIHLDAAGRTLYVSNRGHDSIAVFSVAAGTGSLEQLQVIATGGNWPRNFGIDPSGRWLLVANERSNEITVFRRDAATGRLSSTAQRIAVPKPVCIGFRASRGQST